MLTPEMAMVLARTTQRERERAAAAYRIRRRLRRHAAPRGDCHRPHDRGRGTPLPGTDTSARPATG